VTLGNPKIMMFYLALLPAIVDLGGLTVTGWLELTLAMLSVLITVDLLWVFLAARARMFLKSPRAVRIANRLSAGMMAGAAAAIAAR
jgi:threonine/homoserine/homoserine lactone efflux protein